MRHTVLLGCLLAAGAAMARTPAPSTESMIQQLFDAPHLRHRDTVLRLPHASAR